MQHRVGVAVEAAGMEQRQDHELHGLRRDHRRDAEIDGVPEHHAVGDDRALGMPGGARGVHHHADVVVRQRRGRAAPARPTPARARRRWSGSRDRSRAGSSTAPWPAARTPCRGSAAWASNRPGCRSSSGTVSRQLSGSMIAPSRPQANWSSKYSAQLGASSATRSPLPMPCAASHAASWSVRRCSSA